MINKNLWKESDAVTDALSFTVTLQCAWNIHKQPKRGQSFPHLKRIQKDNKIFNQLRFKIFMLPVCKNIMSYTPISLIFSKNHCTAQKLLNHIIYSLLFLSSHNTWSMPIYCTINWHNCSSSNIFFIVKAYTFCSSNLYKLPFNKQTHTASSVLV